MSAGLLCALLGPAEAEIVCALDALAPRARVVRRCADLTELLAAAQAGLGEIAVVTGDLPGLDRDVVARLRADGVRTLVVTEEASHPGSLGAERVTTDRPDAVLEAVLDLLSHPARTTPEGGAGDPRAPGPLGSEGERGLGPDEPEADPFADPLLETGETPWEDGSDAGDPGDPPGAVGRDPDGRRGSGGRGTGRGPGGPGASGPVPEGWAASGPVPEGRRASGPDPEGRGPTGRTGDSGGADRHGGSAPREGRLVAVWGPTGAPGRSTIAAGLAAVLADRGRRVILADADTYGGTQAVALGLLDEAPGLAAAARAAATGHLDRFALAALAPTVGPFRVLTGMTRPGRWPELPAAALVEVWRRARELADWTVADCGFCLESDELLTYDTAAPQRNAATLTTLREAQEIVVVGSGDPVGLQRLVRALCDLDDLRPAPTGRRLVCVNRVRSSAVGGRPEATIPHALARYAGLGTVHLVPLDVGACDRAVLRGRTLVESAPNAPVTRAVGRLADALTGAAGRAATPSAGRGGRTRQEVGA